MALLAGLLLSAAAAAAVDIHQYSSEAQEQRYRALIGELRCPKCQNTSIADSNAVIAGDMRDKVYALMQQGQSNQQIIDYMVARYGRFVTYTPPLNPLTLLLWLVPLLFVAVGATVVIVAAARRKPQVSALSAAQKQRLTRLLPPSDRNAP